MKVGIEAAGHNHRPVLNAAWRVGWEILEFNPSDVTEKRRVLGKRTIKTDVIDLHAMTAGGSQSAGPRSMPDAG